MPFLTVGCKKEKAEAAATTTALEMGLPVVSPARKHPASLNKHSFLECSPSSAGRELYLPYKGEHKEAILKQHMV